MNFLSNLSIKMKIMLLLVFPILGLVFFATNSVIDKTILASEMRSVETLAELAVKVSALVHETQKERGMTAGFIGSNGEKFVAKLPAQRKNVDNRRNELNSYLNDFDRASFSKAFNQQLDAALGNLDKIANIRNNVSSLNIKLGAALGYYTNMNGTFLNLIGSMNELTNNGEVTRLISAYSNFLLGKERAGIERAVLSGAFGGDKFAPGMFKKFGTLVSEQNTYVNVFKSFASKKAINTYDKKMQSDVVTQVNSMRDIAYAKASKGGFGVDAGVWFSTITSKINLLKEMENWLSENLLSSVKSLQTKARIAQISFLIIALVAGALALFMAFVIARNITVALGQTLAALKDIAEGEGDLTQRLNESGRDEIAQVAIAFNKFASKIESMVAEIKASTNSIDISSNEIAKGNLDLSQRTEEQASSLEETASSMEEMTSTVKQNADNARQANQLAMTTREGAEKGGTVLANAVNAMGEISSSSKEIADIIGVIDEIAFQTNLLALNAAVEAARAGEQGRGFAVVASEVRTLAGRSADAAKEIKELINNSVQKVELGSELVDESGKTLEEIVSGVKKVTDIIAEIAASSQEQANGIEQVNSAVMQMDEMTQQNAALVEEASAASISMQEQSQALSQLVSQFKVNEISGSGQLQARKPISTTAKKEFKAAATEARKPVARKPAKVTSSAGSDSEWDEF